MDRFIYLLLALFLLVPWLCIFWIRNDLRTKIWKVSLVGGLAGLLSEYWYFVDYWQPPTIVRIGRFAPEDFLFGFAITGVCACVYDLVTRTRDAPTSLPSRKKAVAVMFLCGIVLLAIGTNLFHINSILVSSSAFLLFAAIVVCMRRGLLIPCVLSGTAGITMILPVYALLFNVLAPHYWDTYWLLSGSPLDVRILGNIPGTEMLWYFSWGCLAGVLHPFARGLKKVPL